MKDKKILIIVPAYNEEPNIRRTIDDILSVSTAFEVLVINDGSCDRTAQEAMGANASVVTLPFNLGIGGAVQTGFQYAVKGNFDMAIQVDGDGQHDALFIEELVKPILADQADMVIGSRFVPPFSGYQSSFVRRIGIHFFAYLISFLTGYQVTDPTSGFRAYNRTMIHYFAANYPQDFPEPEAIVLARRLNARVIEVPVKMRQRIFGHSSIRYLKTLYYMIKVTFAVLLDMMKKKEIKKYEQ